MPVSVSSTSDFTPVIMTLTNDVTTSSCPYCFQTKPSPTPATPSLHVGTEGGVLDAEIEHVEKLISSLFLERSRLCRKRNKMRSPIYSLPQEILTRIFKFAIPPPDFLRMHALPHPRIIGRLAMVSVHWHHVVSSTPSLWASFVADDHNIHVMQTIFARSGNLPVVASLVFPIDSVLREPHMAASAPLLHKNASRISMLYVHHPSSTWLKEHVPSFVRLKLLCLGNFGWNGDEPVVIDSPCTSLVLINTDRISFPWSQLEVLHLICMPTYDCLELLKKCPRLREYRVREPSDVSFDEGQLPTSPFTLPCLELFEWMVNDQDPMDCAMLKYIRMPILRTLVWNENFANLNPSDFSSSFFEHLPSTLSAVELQHCTIHSNFSIFSYITNLSNVERLTLMGCTDSFMDGVFSDLGSETCLVENQEMSVLPNLKSIYVDDFNGDLDQAKILKTFQRNSLQPLESPAGSPFRLEFADHEVDWTPEFKKELIRMVEEGYKVELWEESQPVDWLPRAKLPRQ